MKIVLLLLLLWTTSVPLMAGEKSAEELTAAAVARLEKRIDAAFSIPFPKEWDIDVYLKQPIAKLAVEGGKISATRPQVNPYDGSGTVEWMIGPEDHTKLLSEGIDCMLSLEDDGTCLQIGLLCSGDPWTAEDRVKHQLHRDEKESGPEFFARAMATYRLRAGKAKDPAKAALVLAGFEKIAAAILALRKEEAMRSND